MNAVQTHQTEDPAWVEFESSCVERARYWAENEWLDIEFTSGKVYRYHAVDADLWGSWLSAPSVGRYYNREVKDKFMSESLDE